jgi:hypothetical protein
MLLEVLLELLVIILNNLRFLLGKDLRYIIKVALDAFD